MRISLKPEKITSGWLLNLVICSMQKKLKSKLMISSPSEAYQRAYARGILTGMADAVDLAELKQIMESNK